MAKSTLVAAEKLRDKSIARRTTYPIDCWHVCKQFSKGRVVAELVPQLRLVKNGVPYYVQLQQQLAEAIASGALKPGDQLPTLRDVALRLGCDLGTVQSAYDELRRQGLLVLERGRGTFVTGQRDAGDSSRASVLDALASHAVDGARALGFTASDLADAIARLAAEDSHP